MKRLLAVACAALSIHASSHADVMYKWVGEQGGKPANVAMSLVFSDAAVAAGSLAYHVEPGRPDTSGALTSFFFKADGINPMTYAPAQGGDPYGLWRMDLNLRFDPAGYLTGSIFANDQNSDFTMADRDGLFTFSALHSDQDPSGTHVACNDDPSCVWSSGRLVRLDGVAAADAPLAGAVPEPGSLALVGLGLLALGRRARRPNARPR